MPRWRRFDYTTRAGANRLRFVLRVLNYSRGSILVLAIAIGVLFSSSQGRDIAAGMSDGPLSWRICFVTSVIILAWQVWWAARRQLNDRLAWDPKGRCYECEQFREERGVIDAIVKSELDNDDGRARAEARRREAEDFLRFATRFAQYWPRALAASVWAIAVLSVGLAQGLFNGWTWLLVVLGVVMYLALVYRREPKIGRFRNPLVHESGVEQGWDSIVIVSQVLGVGTAVISIGWLIGNPIGFAFTLGSLAVAFVILAALDFMLHQLVWRFRESGLPLYVALVVMFGLTALVSRWLGDNHGLRVHPDGQVPSQRASAEEVLASWTERACEVEGERPLAVVATSGGGLRASYWTTRVLTAIQAHAPSFPDQLVAISGASGGSVGATVWVTWLRGYNEASSTGSGACPELPATVSDENWTKGLQGFYANDYLAPLVAGLLYPDLAQRFVPAPVFRDRASYLEQGWERGFADAALAYEPVSGTGAIGLDAPFAELAPPQPGSDQPWLPVLLINGTHQQTGARILTTPMAVDPAVFPYSIDFYATSEGADLPISTAAHNSARFPFFSPSGSLLDGTGHVIDGGYAENYGAATALDLLEGLARARPDETKIRPVIIQITNDAELDCDYAMSEAPVARDRSIGGVNDLFGPVEGIVRARSGRAKMAGTMLANWTRDEAASAFPSSQAPVYAHFRLFETCDGGEPAPLGWVLSNESRQTMEAQLWCTEHNRAQLRKVVEALTGSRLTDKTIDEKCPGSIQICDPCSD